MKVFGILEKKLGTREGESSNGVYRVTSYLFTIPGEYTKHIAFDVRTTNQDREIMFDRFLGKNCAVSFDIDARESNGRWWNKLTAWGVSEALKQTVGVEEEMPPLPTTPPPPPMESELPWQPHGY